MTKTKLYTTGPARFSRQWWLDSLRSSFFVALVSLLIWVYADMQVAEEKDFGATVTLNTGDSKDLVLLSSPKVETKFKLRGTRRNLRLFQSELDEGRSVTSYDVSRGHMPGENDLPTEDLLEHSHALSHKGLSVVSSTPSKISFVLNKWIRRTARIELDAFGATLSGEPKIEPAEIGIRLAEGDLADMNLPADAPIVLKTGQLDLSNAPTGQPYTVEARIVQPTARFPVDLETKTVKVTVVTEQRTDKKDVTITVHVIAPSDWTQEGGAWQEYRLVKKDPLEWRKAITISGTKKDIDRLRPEDIDAHIVLTEDDKTPVASWLSRTVTVRFPAGMDLQISDRPVVHFRLEKRAPLPAAPQP